MDELLNSLHSIIEHIRGQLVLKDRFASPELKLLLERAENKLVIMEKAASELEKYDLVHIAKVEA
jgi:hypothetical protein